MISSCANFSSYAIMLRLRYSTPCFSCHRIGKRDKRTNDGVCNESETGFKDRELRNGTHDMFCAYDENVKTQSHRESKQEQFQSSRSELLADE